MLNYRGLLETLGNFNTDLPLAALRDLASCQPAAAIEQLDWVTCRQSQYRGCMPRVLWAQSDNSRLCQPIDEKSMQIADPPTPDNRKKRQILPFGLTIVLKFRIIAFRTTRAGSSQRDPY